MTHPINILITGQVDHGKSTLIGRLLHECGQMPPEVKAKLDKVTAQYGQEAIEWAFALDSLELERQQGITLDASRVWLKRADKELVLIDVPGHHELLANMLTGASDANAALVLIDAHEGITTQTRLHAKLIQLLGIEQLVVAITKMDRVDYSETVFNQLTEQAADLFPALNVPCVPISAKGGDNLTALSEQMPWYQAQPLLDYMDQFSACNQAGVADAAFRLPIQDVIKAGDQRIIIGKIASGQLAVGDELISCPSGSVALVKEFIQWREGLAETKTHAMAGESVGLTLTQPIFSRRGEVLAHPGALPYFLHTCRAQMIWLGEAAMQPGDSYTLRLGTQSYRVTLHSEPPLIRHQLGEAVIHSRSMMVVDDATDCSALSRFVLEDSARKVVAAGMMQPDPKDDQKQQRLARKSDHITPYQLPISPARYEQRNGHKGAVFWMSGLSGSGKSTLAIAMQTRLFDRGYQIVILDGDNMRSGLARDLGFSEADRSENIRRAAEVAKLFASYGNIVITAFITPTTKDQDLAATICGKYLRQVHVKADVALCEQRDSKGLYQKARRGEIKDFTGISAPYDIPEAADIIIDTSTPLSDCTQQLAEYIEQQVTL